MSWSGAPWWKAQERSDLYQFGSLSGIQGGAALVWTRFFSSKTGSSSAYAIGIRPNCGVLWTRFCRPNCWGACCRGCCWYHCWYCCWGLCRNCSGFCATASKTDKVLNFSNSPRCVVTVGTKGVSQNHLLSFDNNKVLKIINWIC